MMHARLPLPSIVLCALLLAAGASWADTAGRIVGVIDGDTADLLTPDKRQVRIRLAGIDAPEKGQPFGKVAKKLLSDLAYGKPARIEGDKVDRYGRLVGKVIVNGADVNLAMVSRGLAWHFKKYETEQSPADRRAYAQAQDTAQASRLGLWQDPHATAPWEFRSQRTSHASSTQTQSPSGIQPARPQQAYTGGFTTPAPSTCYVGPRGGTYTITPSGKKNYRGC